MSEDQESELKAPSVTLEEILRPDEAVPTEQELAFAQRRAENRIRKEKEHGGEKDESDYPSCIIRNRLYLGNRMNASDFGMMKEMNITHILNITDKIPNYHANRKTNDEIINEHEIRYANIRVLDVDSVELYDYFVAAADFIDSCPKGECVLVHCAMGVSRSATTVISYLMSRVKWPNHSNDDDDQKESEDYPSYSVLTDYEIQVIQQKREETRQLYSDTIITVDPSIPMPNLEHCSETGLLSLHDAYYLVLHQRPVVCPNQSFCRQLARYERYLHRDCQRCQSTADQMPMYRGGLLNDIKDKQEKAEARELAAKDAGGCCSSSSSSCEIL